MKLVLRELPEGHSQIDEGIPADDLDIDPWVTPKGPVQVRLDVDKRDQQLTLRGQVRTRAERTCARCLVRVVSELVGELMLFADSRGSDDATDERVLEQEGSVLYHDGKELDLDVPLREALILEVSQIVLCQEGCRGLCPSCGQDRNKTDCTCSRPSTDPRWQALEELNKSESNQKQ